MENIPRKNPSTSHRTKNLEVNSLFTNDRPKTPDLLDNVLHTSVIEDDKGSVSQNPPLHRSKQSANERNSANNNSDCRNNRKDNTKYNRNPDRYPSHANNNLPNVDSAGYWKRGIDIDSHNIEKEESTAGSRVNTKSISRSNRANDQNSRVALSKPSTKNYNPLSTPSAPMKADVSQSKSSSRADKTTTRDQMARKSVDTSASVFRDVIDDERLMNRSLVIHNVPEITEERRDQLGQVYLSLLHGGGGSALRWVSPSTCLIVFSSENLCQRGIDRSMRRPDTAEFPPKLLSSMPELCSYENLKVARELYDNIPAAQRDARVANRMITAALGIRMPRAAVSASSAKPVSTETTNSIPISISSKDNSACDSRKGESDKVSGMPESVCGSGDTTSKPASVFRLKSSQKEPLTNNS